MKNNKDSDDNELTEVIPINSSQSITQIIDGIRTTEIIDIVPETPESSHSTPSSSLSSPPQSPPCPSQRGHENNEIACKVNTEVHFLEVYWNIIKFSENGSSGNRCSGVLTLLWKLFWILLLSLTTFDTLTRIKDGILDVKNEQSNVELTQAKLVTLAYRITQLLLKVAFIIIATRSSCAASGAFKHMNPRRHPNMAYVPAIVIIVILLVSVACVVAGLGLLRLDEGWSFAKLTYYHFEAMYNRVLLWRASSERPVTSSALFFYGAAIIDYMMHFASRIVELTIESFLLLTSVSFFLEVKDSTRYIKTFNQKIQTPEEGNTRTLRELGDSIMAAYRTNEKMTKEMNDEFGIMFAFIHGTNLTLFVFWAHEAYTDFEIGAFVWAGIEVGIAGVAYVLAVFVAIMASGYEDWVLSKNTRTVINISGKDFVAMLHEITKSPIGIGSGILYINFDFIVGFIVLAFHSFVTLLRAATSST